MLKSDATRQRLRKVSERRYGISLVYGLPICDSLHNVIKNHATDVERNYPNIFHWYTIKNLHATILRCRSSDKPSKPPLSNMQIFHKAVATLTAFCLGCQKVQVGSDGVLRFFSKEVVELSKINLNLIDQFADANSITYTLITAPWISIGDVRNSTEAIDCLTVQFDNINKELEKTDSHIEIVVDTLKLVYYEDVKFCRHTILDSFGIKS